MAEKQDVPLAPAQKSNRFAGIFPPNMPLSGVSKGIEFLAEGVGLETTPEGIGFSGSVPFYQSAKKGLASIAADPMGALKGAGQAVSGMIEEQMQASSVRPGQMVRDKDGTLRQATSDELASTLDPTLGGTLAAPLITRGAVGGLEGLMPRPGVLASGGDDLFGPGNVEGVARSTVRGPGSIDVPPDKPFYNAGEAYASEIVEPIALTTLKKRVNKEGELSDTDRKFLFDAMDKAVDEKGMITPDALRKVVNEQSQISDVRISAQRPVYINQITRGLDLDSGDEKISTEDYKQGMGRENHFEVDNPTGQAEVGVIRISLPKSRFKEKSGPLSAEEVDKIEKEGLEAQLKAGKRTAEILGEDNVKITYSGILQDIEDGYKTLSMDEKDTLLFRQDMIEDGASMKEVDAAYPNNSPAVTKMENLFKESRKLQNKVNRTQKTLETADSTYQGPKRHYSLSDDLHKVGESPLAFARYVERRDVFHPDNINPYIGVNSGQRGRYHQLLDIQSDYINDANKGVNVGDDIFPDATSNTKTIRTATVRAAMKDALDNGQQGVILPSELTSNRPDLYKMEDMGEMATEIAREFGDDFKAVQLDVPAYQRAGAEDLSDAGISTDADIKDGKKYKHWAIVRKLDSDAEAPKTLRFATGGLVSLPPRPASRGIEDVIRKYRRDGLMD